MEKYLTVRTSPVSVSRHPRATGARVRLVRSPQGVHVNPDETHYPGVSLSSYRAEKLITGLLTKEQQVPTKGKAGRIVKSGRLFGVELELIRGKDELQQSTQLTNGLQLGNDGSVNGQSLELRTAPVSGTSAELLIMDLLDLSTSSTDRSCGMHVHVDARDFMVLSKKGKFAPFRRLVALYLASQRLMFSLVPGSRRANTYAKHIHFSKTAVLGLLDNCADSTWVKSQIYAGDRYRYFNLAPYYNAGHYEVRIHQGTSDKRKVLEWANLHTLMADAAMRKGVVTVDLVKTLMSASPSDALDALAEAIGLQKSSHEYYKQRLVQFSRHRSPECDECGCIDEDLESTEDSDL